MVRDADLADDWVTYIKTTFSIKEAAIGPF
jgi:hypothetical protein